MSQDFVFCPLCAVPLKAKFMHERERAVCPACGFVRWRNPVVGVAVIVRRNCEILLGRRSRGEYAGQWCIPCGYVEYDEHVRDAARREFAEETGLNVIIGDVYTVHSNFHNPKLHTVGIWFLGEPIGGQLQAGDDLDAVEYVDISRNLEYALAFPTDGLVIEQLRADLGST